jgi:hypothetical protein
VFDFLERISFGMKVKNLPKSLKIVIQGLALAGAATIALI